MPSSHYNVVDYGNNVSAAEKAAARAAADTRAYT
jgi:hypothetical protein